MSLHLEKTGKRGGALDKYSKELQQIYLEIWSDSDWATDKLDRKSVSGFLVFLSGQLVSWQSRKQKSVSTSSTEAEYVAGAEACKEGRHLYNLLSEMMPISTPINVYMDNQGAIFLGDNAVTSRRSKHIDICFHLIRDWIREKLMKLSYVSTEDNRADMMTKALAQVKLGKFRRLSGVY